MRHLFSVLLLLAVLILPGCARKCTDENPTPTCFSGKVVGASCMDGLLIEVDSQYAIGQPYAQYTNLVAGTNLLPNRAELIIENQTFTVGQTIYFTYTKDPGTHEAFCPQNTASVPVPHLVLRNVGTSACSTSPSN